MLDIRAVFLVINAVCRARLQVEAFCKEDLPNLCSFSYITAFSCFELCMHPTALPESSFSSLTSVTARQALPYLTHVTVALQNHPHDSQISDCNTCSVFYLISAFFFLLLSDVILFILWLFNISFITLWWYILFFFFPRVFFNQSAVLTFHTCITLNFSVVWDFSVEVALPWCAALDEFGVLSVFPVP